MASGSFSSQLSSFPQCTLMIRDVPHLYIQLEAALRQLRLQHHETLEGQQRVFYTMEELGELLKKTLLNLQATGADFRAAIKFIHQVKWVGFDQSCVWVWKLVGGV